MAFPSTKNPKRDFSGIASFDWLTRAAEPLEAGPVKPRRILSLITATADTRAGAICRALLRATRCPRWPGLGGRQETVLPEIQAAVPLRLSPAS